MELETGKGGQRYLLGVWIVASIVTPIMGYLGARGFAPEIGVLGLFCLPMAKPARKDWIGFGLLAALVVWAVASILWSPMLADSSAPFIKQLERFTGLHLAMQLLLSGAFVAAASRLNPPTAHRALKGLSYGLMVLAAILLVEGMTQAAIYQRAQLVIHEYVRPDLAVRNVALGGYVLAVLLWPVGTTLWRDGRRLVVGALALAVGYSTLALRGDSPSIALIVSAAVFFAVLKGGRRAVLAMGALTMAFFLFTPWAMLAMQKIGLFAFLRDHLPASWGARIDIWTFTTARMLEDPLQGWGLDASRMFPGYIHLHPHNSAVQIWFELGALGAVLAAAFWGFLFWRIAEAGRGRVFAATACATATVYLMIGAISFSLWQEWWICLGAFALAACVALGHFIGEPAPVRTHKPKAVSRAL